MRVALIVTYRDSELWEKAVAWPIDKTFPQSEVRVTNADNDKILLLHQADSDEDSEDDQMIDSRRATTEWLIALANSENYKAARIYLATHAGYADIVKVQRQITNERFQTGAEFNHERRNPVFESLLSLFESSDKESFDGLVDNIALQQKRTYAQRLSTLKHRLAHVFLPVTVDLHAWGEFNYDDLYLQEIRDTYRFDEGRLDRARSLIYRESSISDNVENIVRERQLHADESWLAIKDLLPPKSREQQVDASDDYDEFKQARAVLESLQDREKLVQLRTQLRDGNTFGAWCKELDNHLAELVGKVDG
jgi:hypothetical protein